MEKLLFSACLIGNPVRYNGKALSITETSLQQLEHYYELVPLCPEVSAGLAIPRPPAEIVSKEGDIKVIQNDGLDVSKAFENGAQIALERCLNQQIKYALLTDFSPSCGSSKIYDGSFSNTKINGIGITAAKLEQHGIRVFSQFQTDALINLAKQRNNKEIKNG